MALLQSARARSGLTMRGAHLPMLDLRALTCRFRPRGLRLRPGAGNLTAVDGVSLSVGRGEIVGLVGESGCGKSTLAKAVLGLGEIEAEAMLFDRIDIRRPLSQRPRELVRRIQYVFQDPLGALDPRRSVLYQVAEPLLIHRLAAGAEARDRARAVLRDVSLGEEVDAKFPHELSGGQRQRAVIARALVLEPDLLICDEPVSALDVSIQAQVVNLLRDLRDRRGLSILFISHDLAIVRHLCDRVVVMYLGRLCEEGVTETVFRHPRHPYTRALIAAIPPAHPREAKEIVRLSGEPPSPSDPPPGCRFHPRCRLAEAICRQAVPELTALDSGEHRAACHVANRSATRGATGGATGGDQTECSGAPPC